MTDAASLNGIAALRAQTYFLFSRLIHERPTVDSLDELAALPPPAPEEGALAANLADLRLAAAGAARDPARVTALAVEFTRLLGGLSQRSGAPPIESVTREGRLLGDATAAVSAVYTDAGLPEPLPEAGPPDHLASELRFLALCCYEEAEAWKRADEATALAWLERERAFLDDHVLAWVPAYCADIAKRAQEAYYVAAARLIAQACALDREDVIEILHDARRAPFAARR